MAAKKFPFITDGIHGDVPNGFYPAADSDRQVILYPSPGLKALCTLTDCSEVRGLYAWGKYLYAVARRGGQSVLWRVDTSGGFSELGTITTSTTGPVWIVNNLTQLCVCDGVWAYVYTPSTGSFVKISDPAFPGASSVDYQDGYGLFTKPNSNQWFFSSLFDFLTFNALDFYSKESRPDNIVSLFSYKREPLIGGQTSIEVWYNQGGDNTSPQNATFARNVGGVIEHGFGSAKCIADMGGDALVFLSDEGQLLTVSGYQTQPVSNQMFDREVKTYSTYADAQCFSYREGGHIFYQITFPTAGVTWVFDATTKLFHKRQSFLDGSPEFGRHRANCYALLNNSHWVGDYENGKIYEMAPGYYDDDGKEIRREIYSQNMDGGLSRIFFPPVQVIVEGGVGLIGGSTGGYFEPGYFTPGYFQDSTSVKAGVDPQIMLQYSGDNGHTWSNEMWQSAGKIGEYGNRAIWHRQGSGFRRMYRLAFSDPVLWRVLGIDTGLG